MINLLDQSHNANEQQKWLEQNVVKMNYKSFTQIVILGSSTFIPFMQLSASNRRDVIEDLLDIRIFTAMNNVIKDKIRLVRDDIKTLTLKKESLNDKVAMQENFIKELETNSNERIEKKKKKMDALGDDICVYTWKMSDQMNSLWSYRGSREVGIWIRYVSET